MNQMNPKVSIILVNYNGTDDTIDCINSLHKISYRNYEIIVVDNASKDVDTLEELLQPMGVMLLKSKENLGFAGGNNLGINYALYQGTDYALLLNNDTVVDEKFLDKLLAVSENNLGVGIVTGKILFYSSPDHIWFAGGEMNVEKAMTHHLGANELDSHITEMKEVSFVTGCLMLIPADVLNKVGVLDETYFMYSEDVDYCCRIKNSGKKMIYTSESVIYHKVSTSTGGRGSVFSQYYRARNDLRIIQKYAHNKVKAYFYYALRLIKRIIVGQFQLSHTFRGLKAGITGEIGKAEKI